MAKVMIEPITARHEPTAPWVERHTFWPIVFVGLAGAVVAFGAGSVLGHTCSGANTAPSLSFVCEMAKGNPPWLMLTALAAAPSALLTWYWRTAHRKRELVTAAQGQVAQRFAVALELLGKPGVTPVGAIYALEQVARDSPSDHWTVVETLATFVRRLKPGRDFGEWQAQAQAAITVLGRRNATLDPPDSSIDLRETILYGLRFDDLNFARARFGHAAIDGATFFGTDLRGASLSVYGAWSEEAEYYESMTEPGVPYAGSQAVFDDSTLFDDASQLARFEKNAQKIDRSAGEG